MSLVDCEINHIQHKSVVYNPVSKTGIKSREKTGLESHQLCDLGYWSFICVMQKHSLSFLPNMMCDG